MRFSPPILAFAVLFASCGFALADAPTDELLALVPADSAIVLVIDNFRDRSREVLSSSLFARLEELPAVRAWAKSAKAAELRKTRADVETGLGMSLGQLRDDLLGDSVVLALSLPARAEGGDASGILLSRVRDRAALERLIAVVNKSETDEGVLKSVEELPRSPGRPLIRRRTFKPGTKPDEWYAILPGDTFVWSNSERLLRGVVERRPGEGFGNSPRYRSIRDRLPANALARLYVDPHAMLEAASTEKAPPNPQVEAVLRSLDFLAAALEWRDGPIVHIVETIDLDRLPPAMRPTARGNAPDPLDLSGVPNSAIVVAAWRWNLASTYDVILGLVPTEERPRIDATLAVAQGLLMGKDVRREILPAIGPGGFAFLDPQKDSALPNFVAAVDLKDRQDVADAIGNAFRTVASLWALDMNRKSVAVRLENDHRDGLQVTRIVREGPDVSFAAGPRRVVIGSDANAVQRAMAKSVPTADAHEISAIGRLKEAHFSRASGFVAIDIDALDQLATTHRAQLVRREAESKKRPESEVGADFQKLLDLLGPFGGAFVACDVSDDGRSMHQVVGLVGRRDAKPR